jgi:hypothetical protein
MSTSQESEWIPFLLLLVATRECRSMVTPEELTTSVGRQVPMVITSKEAKGLKSYMFGLREVQEFEEYARFARNQSVAGTLTWDREVRNNLIDAPAKRKIPTLLVMVKDTHNRPLLNERRDEWLEWEDEQFFRALRVALTDGPMGKSSAGSVVEKVRSLQLHIKWHWMVSSLGL